jgi:hypothetical protein
LPSSRTDKKLRNLIDRHWRNLRRDGEERDELDRLTVDIGEVNGSLGLASGNCQLP